jgi:integrase
MGGELPGLTRVRSGEYNVTSPMRRDAENRDPRTFAVAHPRLDRALDRFIGDMARRNFTPRSRDAYYRHLSRLFDHLPADATVAHVTPDAIRTCLDGWADASASTRYKVDSMFRAFSRWLYVNELADRNPMDRIPRPKRTAPDEVPLRAISGADVRRLFEACRTTREFLCLATIAYLGSRRGAASQLRWRDVDLGRRSMRRAAGCTWWHSPIPTSRYFASSSGPARSPRVPMTTWCRWRETSDGAATVTTG